MNKPKHLSTIYFYHKTVIDCDRSGNLLCNNTTLSGKSATSGDLSGKSATSGDLSGKETDNVDIYDLYRDYNEMTIKKEDTVIMRTSPSILFIDALKQIGYTEKDCVYWEFSSYCYDGWDITDIMKIPIINIPDIFDFYIGDKENGVPYNEQ